jgi:hypothetical protein
VTVTTRVGISPETEIEWAYEPDFANDPLARVSEILYQVAQSAKDEGRLVFAGQVIAARKIVQGLRDFAEG